MLAKKRAALLGAVVCLAGIGAWRAGLLERFFDQSHGAIATCVEAVREGAVSPSSFQVVWSHYTQSEPTLGDEREERKPARCEPTCSELDRIYDAYVENIYREGPLLQKKIDRGRKLSARESEALDMYRLGLERRKEYELAVRQKKPEVQEALVLVQFDADNQFGAKLRQYALCAFGPVGKDGNFGKGDLKSQ